MAARSRILLLTDAGSSALSTEDRVSLNKLLDLFGYKFPVLMDGGDEFKLAKQRCQWGAAAYNRWPLYLAHEKLGAEPRFHAVVFYGLGRKVRQVGDFWTEGYRLGPVNLICAAACVRNAKPCFVFDGETEMLLTIREAGGGPEWLPGELMVYSGETSVRGRMEKRRLGYVVSRGTEEPEGWQPDDADSEPPSEG